MHKTVFKSFIVSVILVTLGSGFATTVVDLHPTTVEFPKVTRLPMTMGIFYGPKLREDKFLPGLGAASIDLFDRVFPLVAEETTQVARLPVAEGSPRITAIVEPAIEDRYSYE